MRFFSDGNEGEQSDSEEKQSDPNAFALTWPDRLFAQFDCRRERTDVQGGNNDQDHAEKENQSS